MIFVNMPQFQNMNISKTWSITILRVSLSRKVQENKGNQKNGKNTEKTDWLLHQPIKSFLEKKLWYIIETNNKPFNEQIESVKQALDSI